MLSGYRTYVMALAIIVHNILNYFGLKDFTGEQISVAIDVLLAVGVLLFRKLAKKKS